MPPSTLSSACKKRMGSISIFGWGLRITWSVLFALTIVLELIPIPGALSLQLCWYFVCKPVVFLLLGFLTPLVFWRFNSLGYGLLSAIAAASALPWMPLLPEGGHPWGYLELTAKLILVFVGFVTGLNARHNRKLNLIYSKVTLDDPRFPVQAPARPPIQSA
jgi:hypothetical protein